MNVTFTVMLPKDYSVIGPNSRSHWAKKAKVTKAIRRDAFLSVKGRANGPFARRVTVTAVFYFATRRRRDPDNLVRLLKPVLDGIRDSGLVKDDDLERVRIGEIRCEISPTGMPFINIMLREDSDGPEDDYCPTPSLRTGGKLSSVSGPPGRDSESMPRDRGKHPAKAKEKGHDGPWRKVE